jgi:hypothetical protein
MELQLTVTKSMTQLTAALVISPIDWVFDLSRTEEISALAAQPGEPLYSLRDAVHSIETVNSRSHVLGYDSEIDEDGESPDPGG